MTKIEKLEKEIRELNCEYDRLEDFVNEWYETFQKCENEKNNLCICKSLFQDAWLKFDDY